MSAAHAAGRRLISIVVPVYGEAKNLPLLVERFDRLAVDTFRWEYVFVNDGTGKFTDAQGRPLLKN